MKNLLSLLGLSLALLLNAQQTEVQYLSGTGLYDEKEWKFYCSDGLNSRQWLPIKVPSQWEIQGFGEYTYGRWYKAGLPNPSMEQGTYQYTFSVPSKWKNKSVSIVFEGVMTDTEVKINGKQAGDIHQGGFNRFTYDITDKLIYGKDNLLEVKVWKHSANRSVNAAERRADWWLFGGIYRPVYLEARPEVHIERIAVDARADGTLNAEVFTTPLPSGYSIATLIEPLHGKNPFKPVSMKAEKDNSKHLVSSKWNNIAAWSPETPHLYNLTISLKRGSRTIHAHTERIGFRTVEFKPRDGIYVNGTRIVMKGINRHSFHPDGGRCTNPKISLEDVKLIKEMNMNAVRFHYPPDKHFLDMCDSLGLFVVNELAGWQDPYDNKVGPILLKSMVTRDVNHPSIVLWSNGNEGGWNYNLDPLFREFDPQKRHVIHAWADFDELDTHHYPAYQTGVARFNNGYKVFLPAEFMHGMYDQGHGAGLEDFWKKYTESDLFAGGFMWDFSDNAVKRVDKGGILDSEQYNGTDGILGPYREKEASYYTVREIWSPIQIRPFMITPSFKGEIFVTNDYLFSTLEGSKLKYVLKQVGLPGASPQQQEIETGEVVLPGIQPRETWKVKIPVSANFFNADVLEIFAVDKHGVTICNWTYPVITAPRYLDKYLKSAGNQAKASLKADTGFVTLSASGINVVFNAKDGNIAAVTNAKGKVSLEGGPVAIGIKTRFNQTKSRMEGNVAVATFFYFGGVDSIRWEMHPDGKLKMSAVMLTRANFGGGFDDSFMEENIPVFGLTFNYPEEQVKGMQWFGRGPYRVWKNRIRGTNYGFWDKAYNNTITGESFESLIYPEFKGYHANLYWAKMQTRESDFNIYSASDGVFFRVFTPEEPKFRQDGKNTMPDFPPGDLSFLYEIPAIRCFKPVHQHGPNSQPSSIRIKKGDEGVKMHLIFDFN